MFIKDIKKALFISFIGAILGSIQMYWFLPDGLSCIDARSGVIDSIFTFMSIQFLVVALIHIVIKGKVRFYTLIVFLCFFWFFINKNEFTYRHACWSTYSVSNILYYTFKKSILPIIVCLVIFIMGYLLLDKFRKETKTKDKTI